MPDVLDILWNGWKKIIATTLLATAAALLVTLLVPSEYKSVATALPANSASADKARIFNTNIDALYSDIGTSDELDKVLGTAALDTVYISTAKKFYLVNYYHFKPLADAVYHAALRLKKNSKVIKNAYGELQVMVWDEDKYMASALANNIMQELQRLHQSVQNESNEQILKKLKEEYLKQVQLYAQTSDSSKSLKTMEGALAVQKTAQLEQLQQYQKLMSQYQLIVNTNPQALLLVEKARPSLKPDKPDRLQIALLTFFASALFSFLVLLFIESRKANAGRYTK